MPSLAGLLAASALLATAPPAPQPTDAAAPAADRTADKASFILALTDYVEWPPDRVSPARTRFVIGVLGDEPLRRALVTAAAGLKGPHPTPRVRGFRNLDEVEPCAILEVGREKARLLPVILDFLDFVGARRGLLTVGEREDFLERGGAVRLIERPDRIAFEVNLAATERAGLGIRSELLRLAERVLPARAETGAP